MVDDNVSLRENIAECLQEEGFQVILAGDGARALESLAAEPLPAVAIIDLMMPRMSGAELVARIRSEPRLAGLRVILSTGMSPLRDAVGADAILVKPYGASALIGAVRGLLEA